MKQNLLDKETVKVIHSCPIWLPQTQTWLYNQIRYLADDVENHIVCEVTENLTQFNLPNIHAFAEAPRWRRLWDRGLQKLQVRQHLGWLVHIVKREGIDIVHSHFGPLGWINLGAIRQTGAKHCVTFYGYDVNHLPKSQPVWSERYRQLFGNADLVLCEGSHMAQCIINLGCPEHKVKVHHLGIAIDEIAFQPRTWSPKEPLRVLVAGSFREKKGIPHALEALGRLQHEVNLEITLIGDAGADEQSQTQKQLILATIQKHHLESKVRLLGYQPHTVFFKEAYSHHIFLSPSTTASDGDTEGGAPVSLLEVAATGMPIVSTRHCDIPEVVIDGVTGLLSDERDVEGLIGHLRKLVNFPEKWYALVKAGRDYMEAEYDARTQGLRLATLYRELIKNS